MIERELIITTKHGTMPSFTACPEGPGTWPAVILLMDAPGMREELRNHARRIAKGGYFCLLPDMYYRLGTIRLDLSRRDDAMTAVVRAARQSLTDTLVKDDMAAILSFVDAQAKVTPGPVGTVGHCMSGRYITTTAAQFPHRIKAAASLYGVGLVTDTDDSPHRHLAGIAAELYYGFGEIDKATPPSYVAAFRAALDKAGVKFSLDVFPGADHGYCFAERQAYSAAAAEESWRKLFDLWRRNLNGH